MKARTFVALAVVTLLAVIAVAAVRPPLPGAVSGVGEKLFADLPNRIEDASTIVVRSPAGTVTLERGEQAWLIRERGGYPASFEKVRDAVIALLELERTEPKTGRAEGYARLGLSDSGDAEAAGREIAILDASGRTLARVIVGKTVHAAGGDTSQFVRVPGEERAWLARGRIDAGAQPRDWIDRRLLDIPSGEISRLHVVRRDGTTLTVVRDGADSPQLTLQEVPKGARVKRPEALQSMIGVFSPLDIEDVAEAAAIAAAAQPVRLEVTRFGGETVTANVNEWNGEYWLTFAASAAAGGGPAPFENARQRLAKWAFQVPAWKIEPLLKPIGDLIETADGTGPRSR